ncbi:MAG: hypothetical protein ABI318_09185, partial [Chthoniobacteraceae bacterium]
APQAFCKNALGYSGYWGIWGWSYCLRATGAAMFQKMGVDHMPAAQAVAMAATKYLIIGGTLWLAWRRRRQDVFLTMAGVWALFFVCASGIAPQYFVWLAPFVLMASPRWYAAITGASAVFLFVFYNTISGGLPWDRGISENRHVAIWGPWSLLPWVTLIAFLVWLAPRMLKAGATAAPEAASDESAKAPEPMLSTLDAARVQPSGV